LSPATAILAATGDSYFGQLIVATDELGAIDYWEMFAGTPATISNDNSACQEGSATCIGILTVFNYLGGQCCPPTVVDYSFYYPFGGATTSLTELDGVQGSWACSPTSDCTQGLPPPPQTSPEPASLLLLGTGLTAVAARRKLH
jgi:hypothetical protein